MSKPSEHKTVQSRILAYAQEIGWTLVSRAEAERRRGKEPGLSSPGSGLGEGESTGWKTRAPLSLYFGELTRCSRPAGSLWLSICAALRLPHGQLRAFNPLYQEAEGACIGEGQRLPSSIAVNRGLSFFYQHLKLSL